MTAIPEPATQRAAAVWTLAEQVEGGLRPVSYELLGRDPARLNPQLTTDDAVDDNLTL